MYIPSSQYSGSQGGSSLSVRATSAHYLSTPPSRSLSLLDSRRHFSRHPSPCISITTISYLLSSTSHPLKSRSSVQATPEIPASSVRFPFDTTTTDLCLRNCRRVKDSHGNKVEEENDNNSCRSSLKLCDVQVSKQRDLILI